MAKPENRKISLDEFPTEVRQQIKSFHDAIAALKTDLQPVIENFEEVEASAGSPLEQARLNYNLCYALNSLFWLHLVAIGENPQEYDIKKEIERLKASSGRFKEIDDKEKLRKESVHRQRVDPAAAKRFVKNALWEQDLSTPGKPTPPKKVRKF